MKKHVRVNLYTSLFVFFVAILLILQNIILPTSMFYPPSTLTSPTLTPSEDLSFRATLISILELTLTPTLTPAPFVENVMSLSTKVAQIQSDVDSINATASADVLESKIEIISTQISTIEDVILENPAKALQVVSLQNDVKNLDLSLHAIKEELDRTSNLYLGILGLIIALAANNIFSPLLGRKAEKQQRMNDSSAPGKEPNNNNAETHDTRQQQNKLNQLSTQMEQQTKLLLEQQEKITQLNTHIAMLSQQRTSKPKTNRKTNT